ncbi:HAMP domain-containing sensor histidine kinase [Clostridium sp. JN-9]|uniref:two-component system histidine kinase PnpS n=1 Tax=Clostridium sp. JN-9 TaxID=2507159 RepID=UPI000FFE2107|nr:HAMP domain-containing sensor histidine kinase [Clostridium sp. JN-9]QAT40122.1 sensor histidine kinase [Clostridium sp. JN-9]
MKRKLLLSMLATLLFSLITITTLFIILVNYEHIESTKTNLKTNNDLIINILNNENIKDVREFFLNNFTDSGIRVTYIDKNGKVLIDSFIDKDTMDNHNNREEVIKARKQGVGYSVRDSISSKSEYIYCATLYNNGYIVRSSMPLKTVTGLESSYLKYYVIILIFAILVSLIFSSNLSYAITKPIKDLEFITSRIAKGEMDRRVNITTRDEIGHLANTFNNMADKLQETIDDSIEKQNRLEAILKSMDSGVIAVDKNYKVIMINPYAKKIFGINKDIIGENLMDNIRDFELEDIFKNDNDEYTEIKIYWPKERDLRIKTADIINGYEKIGTVAVVQNITKFKKLENMRSQFVANVSHELKTPLTSIKGFAETLKDVNDDETKEKFLNIINDEADRLTRLISDILTLSDIENSKERKTEEINVEKTINEVYYLVSKSAENKNIDITLNCENVPDIIGDGDKFKQMIINLVDNAIKYTEAGGKVEVGTKVENETCIIWVKDNGVGIPKVHLSRLFERFYRVDKARSRAQGGTGLGLAIVKHVVMSFNGTIDVKSQVGEGSTFTVSIPYNE